MLMRFHYDGFETVDCRHVHHAHLLLLLSEKAFMLYLNQQYFYLATTTATAATTTTTNIPTIHYSIKFQCNIKQFLFISPSIIANPTILLAFFEYTFHHLVSIIHNNNVRLKILIIL